MSFQKAVREQTKLKIAFSGPSGSGKTFGALMMATGMGKKIGVIDTEAGSAALYSDRFDFDTLTIEAPYTVTKYLEAINEGIKAGFDVLIVDSITPEWTGEGGILDRKNKIDLRGGNSFTNWGQVTPDHDKFIAGLVSADIDLICTMRSKTEYALEKNDKGKTVPQKVGMAPQQRDGMEYEFTLVFDLDMSHQAKASKDRTSLFDGQLFIPTKETGEILREWQSGGAKPKTAKEKQNPLSQGDPPEEPTPPASSTAPAQDPPNTANGGEKQQVPPPGTEPSNDFKPAEIEAIEGARIDMNAVLFSNVEHEPGDAIKALDEFAKSQAATWKEHGPKVLTAIRGEYAKIKADHKGKNESQ